MGALAGKKALITGAAAGIGQATAARFAREGAELVLFGHGGDKLDRLATETHAIAVHGDVTREPDVGRALAACNGRLDIVVNSAGIVMVDDPATMTDEGWERMFAVNVTTAMSVCRAALPLLRLEGGAVVNIASVAAFSGGLGTTAYAASKAALISYTRSLAYAYGHERVRANAVAPGWVRTPMSEREMDEAAALNGTTREQEFEARARGIALRRVADPSEVAACCLFLASDEASFVTGAVLVADGGGRGPISHRAA
jgi:NAD(P)-dependent dehydrogenase (short-subunit alcohol dehydrogenase family)